MSQSKAEAWLAQHPEIESIFACVCDLNGTMRGKRGPADQVSKVVEGGLRMPRLAGKLWLYASACTNSGRRLGEPDGH